MSDQSNYYDRLRSVVSRQNARVKELRRAFHEAAPNLNGEVAIEGMHLLEEAIRAGLRLQTVFFSESARDRAHKLLPQLSSHTETLLLPDDVFAGAVPTETPQGVAALVKVKQHALNDAFAPEPALVVIAAALQDPGNLGTIARSAEAFGATGLLLAERTVSPWNWKAVRASAGSLFRLPAVKVELAKALRRCEGARYSGAGDLLAQGHDDCRRRFARAGCADRRQRRRGPVSRNPRPGRRNRRHPAIAVC